MSHAFRDIKSSHIICKHFHLEMPGFFIPRLLGTGHNLAVSLKQKHLETKGSEQMHENKFCFYYHKTTHSLKLEIKKQNTNSKKVEAKSKKKEINSFLKETKP